MTLADKTCTPCRGGVPPLVTEEITQLLQQVPEWVHLQHPDRICRRYPFKNFVEALDFVNRVGALCESEGHHADIQVGWGYAEVVFYTHKIKGLHENDFIMAARCDDLLK